MKLATWNVGDGPDATKRHGLDHLVNLGVSVLALQEAGDRGPMLRQFCEDTGWFIWDGDGSPGAASVPILWNPRAVEARVTGTNDATPPTHVGRPGAGPSTMKAKVWNRVRFDLGAEHLLVINGHVVPSVYLPTRRRLARRHIAALAGIVERRLPSIRMGRLGVVAVGDFNMKPNDRLTKPLRDLGMRQLTKQPTHGRRTIDHIWALGVTGDVDVIEMPSDHDSAVLTIK